MSKYIEIFGRKIFEQKRNSNHSDERNGQRQKKKQKHSCAGSITRVRKYCKITAWTLMLAYMYLRATLQFHLQLMMPVVEFSLKFIFILPSSFYPFTIRLERNHHTIDSALVFAARFFFARTNECTKFDFRCAIRRFDETLWTFFHRNAHVTGTQCRLPFARLSRSVCVDYKMFFFPVWYMYLVAFHTSNAIKLQPMMNMSMLNWRTNRRQLYYTLSDFMHTKKFIKVNLKFLRRKKHKLILLNSPKCNEAIERASETHTSKHNGHKCACTL